MCSVIVCKIMAMSLTGGVFKDEKENLSIK